MDSEKPRRSFFTKPGAKAKSRARSAGPGRAASGLILGKSAPEQTSNMPKARPSANHSHSEVPLPLGLCSGDLVEVVEAFTSDEKAMKMGKIESVDLLPRQRGKITNMDENHDAYISIPAIGKTVFVCKGQLKNLKQAVQHQVSIPASPADMKAFGALLDKQQAQLTRILTELRTQRRKTSCWAWWVFPTEKEGMCDPDGTRVTKATAALLLSETATVQKWQEVLETICDLVEEKGKNVLPPIDHGRVHWFIKFWMELEASPEWMKDVCRRLERSNWPPS